MDSARGPDVEGLDPEENPSERVVLLVDEDTETRSRAASVLREAFDLRVLTADNAEAALETLEDRTVDCIVSEYGVPGMDELDLLEAVREREPTLPFVLFTAEGSERVASEAITRGVTEYMRKQSSVEQYTILGNRIGNAIDQYRAHQALRESERRYRTVVENSHEGVYIYSGDEFIFANDRIAELTGYEPEELGGVEIWSLLHEDDRERVREIARKRADPDEDAPATYEARVRRKDGEIRHCEFAVEEISYRGEFAALGSLRDITERRERQRRLERFETMVQVSGDPMYTLDEAGRFTFANDRLCEISGYDRADLLGAHVSRLMPAEDVETGESVIATLLEGETEQATFELVVETADDDRIECENHVALLPAEEGAFRGTVGVVRDISERKRRERRLTALHDAASDFERAASPGAVYADLVAAAEEILDFDFVSVDSVEGDSLVMREHSGVETAEGYYAEVPLDAEDNLGARAAREGRTILVNDLETHDVTPADPEYRSALTVPIGNLGIFQAGSKSVDAFTAVDRELSELLVEHARTALVNIENERRLRHQRRELRRENERLEEFASVVSHDLRNPLTVATGRLSDAMTEHESEALVDVERALARMDGLIGDLLTLARQGKRVEDVEPVSLPDLVDSCWRNVSTADATLEVETEATVAADGTRLSQLLENLFRNSVEHARSGGGENGSVTIRVGQLPGGFYVADDGPGIPESEHEAVFEPGYTNSEDGTGFGLSIVDQVADAQGWDLSLRDGDLGGARFEFTGVEFVDTE